jgi:hypothetical protein
VPCFKPHKLLNWIPVNEDKTAKTAPMGAYRLPPVPSGIPPNTAAMHCISGARSKLTEACLDGKGREEVQGATGLGWMDTSGKIEAESNWSM